LQKCRYEPSTLRSGQYEDLDGAASRIPFDDDQTAV
jgi:cbb3-type cytochrome oxidase maturation protein